MRTAVATLAAALAAALVAVSAAGTTNVQSGLFGIVTRGPITPICVADEPCTAPAAGVVLVFTRGGADVAHATTRSNGTYRANLAPAVYAVRASGRRLEPMSVRVRPGTMRRVDFSIDTGIR
jgi:hypothetical protein